MKKNICYFFRRSPKNSVCDFVMLSSGRLVSMDDMKRDLLEIYSDVVKHGRPSLRAAMPEKQLRMYPIMCFLRELMF